MGSSLFSIFAIKNLALFLAVALFLFSLISFSQCTNENKALQDVMKRHKELKDMINKSGASIDHSELEKIIKREKYSSNMEDLKVQEQRLSSLLSRMKDDDDKGDEFGDNGESLSGRGKLLKSTPISASSSQKNVADDKHNVKPASSGNTKLAISEKSRLYSEYLKQNKERNAAPSTKSSEKNENAETDQIATSGGVQKPKFEKCRGFKEKDTLVKVNVNEVVVKPAFLRRGQDSAITMNAEITKGILKTGVMEAELYMGGTKLQTYSYDVCKVLDDGKCPLARGPISGTISEKIPKRAFTGTYTVKASLFANGEQVSCVEFSVQFNR